MSQQHRLPARRRGPDRLVRRLQGGRRAQPLRRQQRAARDHRPERRRQDHRARPDLRQDQGHRRHDQVQGPGTTACNEHQIVRAGIGRKFQTPSIYENLTVFENLEISYPRGRSVFGALAFKRTERGPRAASRRWPSRSSCRTSSTSRPAILEPRPEAVARDRHAADAGPGADDARRAGRRHERRASATRPPSCSSASSRTAR